MTPSATFQRALPGWLGLRPDMEWWEAGSLWKRGGSRAEQSRARRRIDRVWSPACVAWLKRCDAFSLGAWLQWCSSICIHYRASPWMGGTESELWMADGRVLVPWSIDGTCMRETRAGLGHTLLWWVLFGNLGGKRAKREASFLWPAVSLFNWSAPSSFIQFVVRFNGGGLQSWRERTLFFISY